MRRTLREPASSCERTLKLAPLKFFLTAFGNAVARFSPAFANSFPNIVALTTMPAANIKEAMMIGSTAIQWCQQTVRETTVAVENMNAQHKRHRVLPTQCALSVMHTTLELRCHMMIIQRGRLPCLESFHRALVFCLVV